MGVKAIYVDEDLHAKLFMLKLQMRKRSINDVLKVIIDSNTHGK